MIGTIAALTSGCGFLPDSTDTPLPSLELTRVEAPGKATVDLLLRTSQIRDEKQQSYIRAIELDDDGRVLLANEGSQSLLGGFSTIDFHRTLLFEAGSLHLIGEFGDPRFAGPNRIVANDIGSTDGLAARSSAVVVDNGLVVRLPASSGSYQRVVAASATGAVGWSGSQIWLTHFRGIPVRWTPTEAGQWSVAPLLEGGAEQEILGDLEMHVNAAGDVLLGGQLHTSAGSIEVIVPDRQVIGVADLSNAGQVAGTFRTGELFPVEMPIEADGESLDYADHAFLWSRDGATDLGTLGGPDSQAVALNDQGDVIGWSTVSDGVGPTGIERYKSVPFVYRNQAMQRLGDLLPADARWSPDAHEFTLIDINNVGQILATVNVPGEGHFVALITLPAN